MIRRSAVNNDAVAQTGMADLEAIQKLTASPVVLAAFDLPFTPVFLAGIALFHPWLGWLALGGGLVLIGIAVLYQIFSREVLKQASLSSHRAQVMGEEIRKESEMIQAMGMRKAAFDRWEVVRGKSLTDNIHAADTGGRFTSLTKTLRLFLQSAMLGMGAYLVLLNEVTPGAIIAGSILMGRALAPIELGLGQWASVQRARKGWDSLAELLKSMPPEVGRTELPKPKANLKVEALAVMAPGESSPQLQNVSFTVGPGQAVGVIGPTGSGKSTLARALTGAWRTVSGSVRLDGAELCQYGPEDLGRHIGYLPQRVQLFEGTIAQNIARLSNTPDAEQVVAAAKKAEAHDMIVNLPDGYDTWLPTNGGRLSGGQLQRIGLARALYGDPVIVILDEPNSNLGNNGSKALNLAIRGMKAMGKSVLIMAHRPAAIQECDALLVLDQGVMKAIGPKNQVLKQMVANYRELAQDAEVQVHDAAPPDPSAPAGTGAEEEDHSRNAQAREQTEGKTEPTSRDEAGQAAALTNGGTT